MSTMTLNRSISFGKPNVGGTDRLLRAVLGGVLLADAVHGTGPLGVDALLVVAAIPLVISAMIAWDPFYAMFKVRTATLRSRPLLTWRATKLNANGGINVGSVDRISRIAVAAVLLATPFLIPGTLGLTTAVATMAGITVMMTAITGWDPLYSLAKVRTATLPIETTPGISTHSPVDKLALLDDVVGDDEDIYQKAA